MVRNVRLRGKHKLEDKWEPTIYVVIRRTGELPVYTVRPENDADGPVRTLHRDLLLPCLFLPTSDQDLSRATPPRQPRTRNQKPVTGGRELDSEEEDGLDLPHIQIQPTTFKLKRSNPPLSFVELNHPSCVNDSKPIPTAKVPQCPEPQALLTNLPDENLPGENLSGENLPEENLPGENLPDENLPGENLPGENLSGENLPGENLPDENSPEETLPGENLPGEDLPGEPGMQPVGEGERFAEQTFEDAPEQSESPQSQPTTDIPDSDQSHDSRSNDTLRRSTRDRREPDRLQYTKFGNPLISVVQTLFQGLADAYTEVLNVTAADPVSSVPQVHVV